MNLWPVEQFFPHFLTGLLCDSFSKDLQVTNNKNWDEF